MYSILYGQYNTNYLLYMHCYNNNMFFSFFILPLLLFFIISFKQKELRGLIVIYLFCLYDELIGLYHLLSIFFFFFFFFIFNIQQCLWLSTCGLSSPIYYPRVSSSFYVVSKEENNWMKIIFTHKPPQTYVIIFH